MHLLKYAKLDLPEYPEDCVAWTPAEIHRAVRSGKDAMIRRTCLRYEGSERDLCKVLALADAVLVRVCEVMGIRKVRHTWGLAPLSTSTRKRLHECGGTAMYDCGITSHNASGTSLVPSGYGLVAAVDVVADARRLSYDQHEWLRGQGPTGIGVEAGGYWVTNDDLGRPGQYVSNRAEQAGAEGDIVLVDAEPRLHLRSIIG